MPQWAIFLRGVNVGGRNRLKMKDLCSHLESAGCEGVSSYIQSGNLVLSSKLRSARAISTQVQKAILEVAELDIEVHSMPAQKLSEALAECPFDVVDAAGKTLHFFFMKNAPKPENFDRLQCLAADTEELSLIGSTLYLYAPDGIGRSKVAASIEKTLGVTGTGRNLNTILAMKKLMAE